MLFLPLTSTHLKLFLDQLHFGYDIYTEDTLGNFIIVLDFHLLVYIYSQQIRQTLNGNDGINQQF